jgi:hypothetical protein
MWVACGWLVDSLCPSHIVNSNAFVIPKLVERKP